MLFQSGLQRRDRDKLLHGRESGIVMRLPHGEFIEVHEPLTNEEAYELVNHERQLPVSEPEVDANGVAAPGGMLAKLRRRVSRFYFRDVVQKPTAKELEIARSHGHESNGHGELEPSDSETSGREVGSGTRGGGD